MAIVDKKALQDSTSLDKRVVAVTKLYRDSKGNDLVAVGKIANFLNLTYGVPYKDAQLESVEIVKILKNRVGG